MLEILAALALLLAAGEAAALWTARRGMAALEERVERAERILETMGANEETMEEAARKVRAFNEGVAAILDYDGGDRREAVE